MADQTATAAIPAKKQLIGVLPGPDGKIKCSRCKKLMGKINFYTYRDGSQCQMCKPCLTSRIDNFDPSTFVWILQKMDVPYIPSEWNSMRDKAFAKNPKKMNGMSVIGKYLAKMKLKQWNSYRFADSERLLAQMKEKEQAFKEAEAAEKEEYEADLKNQLDQGKISLAEYQTLVSTETQHKQYIENNWGDAITGQQYDGPQRGGNSFNGQIANPFQQQNFIPEDELIDLGADLTKDDKVFLALKWGRYYTPHQWVTLQQLYTEFMKSFDIQGAARIDTLKMICKTSLKMNQAIDQGDIESYQKLSRVYDAMMKSAKFTEAQNKDGSVHGIDSAAAIVDFVEAHSGAIPKYDCTEPQDIVDKIIKDLKDYTKSLIYEDKSLAQEIEKYLQQKKITEQMRKDKKQAEKQGLDYVPIEDKDIVQHVEKQREMKEHDKQLQLQQRADVQTQRKKVKNK